MKINRRSCLCINIFSLCFLSACSKIYSAERLFSMNLDSAVELKIESNDGITFGTAVCVDKEGIFISNAHIIPETNDLKVNAYIRL